jgi:hypothetical protein
MRNLERGIASSANRLDVMEHDIETCTTNHALTPTHREAQQHVDLDLRRCRSQHACSQAVPIASAMSALSFEI